MDVNNQNNNQGKGEVGFNGINNSKNGKLDNNGNLNSTSETLNNNISGNNHLNDLGSSNSIRQMNDGIIKPKLKVSNSNKNDFISFSSSNKDFTKFPSNGKVFNNSTSNNIDFNNGSSNDFVNKEYYRNSSNNLYDTRSINIDKGDNNVSQMGNQMTTYNKRMKTNKKKKPSIFLIIILTAFISAFIGAGSLLLFFKLFPDYLNYTVTNVNKSEKEVTVTDSGIADSVAKVYDSVVIVKTYRSGKLYATGTGFIYKNVDGTYYFITNYHVIESGDKITVVFTSGDEVAVNVENGDKYADIAILSYRTMNKYNVAQMGSSVDMRVGDTVFAIGAPLDSDVYSWSVTRGILSGKDREVEVSTNNGQASDWIMQVLQTDTAINSGNSGGPLCNINGEVIGITNMKLVTSGVEGMGFAIPIELASSYADSVIKGESTARPVIGISMVDASNKSYAATYGVEPREGVIVDSVTADGAAYRAGIVKGDIIIAIDDAEITNAASLRYNLYKYKAGDVVTLKVIRGGKTINVRVTLTSS